jgi:signal transduction histidine kinase
VTRREFPRGEQLDRLVACGLVVLGQVELWATNSIPGPKWVTMPLTLAVTGGVALRRRFPLAVAAFNFSAFAALLLVGQPQVSAAVGISWMCGAYALAVWTETREFVAGFVVLAVTSMVAQLQPKGSFGSGVFFAIVPGLAMLLARRAIRDRQLQADAQRARADMLEREQEMRAHEAVEEERARIARELHDLVAHNVSVMVVQAGVERHALGDDQASTRQTLASIEQAGRQALIEARRLLGVLRRGDEHEELQPQPGVGQIDALLDQVRRAGLSVELEVEGEAAPLPAGLDLCAYRIVQESLTNALKHAGPAHAHVVMRYAPNALEIAVRDDGQGPSDVNGDTPGHGLIGMRERVALYDGRLETGPRADGGFEVRAHLPLP